MHIPVASLLAVLVLTPGVEYAPASAQDKQDRSSGFVLEAGEHTLKDIIDRAAKFLGRNIVLPEPSSMPRGRGGGAAAGGGGIETITVELQKKLILDAVACEEVVSQLVHTRGFVIVPLDTLRGLYEVVQLNGQRLSEIYSNALHLTVAEVLRRERYKVIVRTTFTLKHIRADMAVQNLRQLIQGLQIGTPGTQRSLVLIGFANQVAAAIRMLEDLDDPGKVSTYQSRNIFSHFQNLQERTTSHAKSISDLTHKLAALEALVRKSTASDKQK